MERKYGSGYLRIGQSVELAQDIFCLAFAAQCKDEIILKHFDFLTGKHKENVSEDSDEEIIPQVSIQSEQRDDPDHEVLLDTDD